MASIYLGDYNLGETFTIHIAYMAGTSPAHPLHPHCNITVPGHPSAAFPLVPTDTGSDVVIHCNVPGTWTGTSYVPPGDDGEDAQPFTFDVSLDGNYP